MKSIMIVPILAMTFLAAGVCQAPRIHLIRRGIKHARWSPKLWKICTNFNQLPGNYPEVGRICCFQ